MKKLTAVFLGLLLIFVFTACGDTDKNEKKAVSDTYISESEAEIFFLEITNKYRFELMMQDEDTLKDTVSPEYWPGLAEEICECNIGEIPGEYISEEERALLSTSYGAEAGSNVFSVYRISELQAGIDELFGKGKYDVSLWNKNNIDIIANNIFGTASGYFIFSKTETESFDTQAYNIISVSGGEGKAIITANAIDIDNIGGNLAYDLSVWEEKTDEAGNTTSGFKQLENAAVVNYDYAADFNTNLANLGIPRENLGTVQFIFGINGISICLDRIVLK